MKEQFLVWFFKFKLINMKWILFYTLVITGAVLNSCGGREQEPDKEKIVIPEQQIPVTVPNFNADSAYFFVEQQVAFGPRVPGTEAHKKCANFLTTKLKSYTSDVIVQHGKTYAFNNKVLDVINIIASFQPEKENRILLCAHWDSRPFADHDPDEKNHNTPIDGANDGASGVGVLLEIARHLQQSETQLGIDIILFDVEDYGEPQGLQSDRDNTWALGSQYWSKNPHKDNYNARFGILLDMVGAKDATFTMEGTSMYFAPDIVKKVWDIAHKIGYKDYFLFEKTGGITDDHRYINLIRNIPTIDVIHYDASTSSGFFEHWHTIKDDISTIDKTTLKVVGHTVLTVIYSEK
ncbi:MAG: M28 family peptidase [Bacteroidales bacterium]|nr:M28 family peptidase [Bacteroidales bacterium]